ncbi:MAG: hypothetical protein ABR991_00255 [Terracidiphilus sp.]|jgi:hypothetical protein
MAAAISQPTHPYFEEIGRLFYNYRLAQFNRRYYTVLLARKKSWNLLTEVLIGLLSAAAASLISMALAFHQSTDLLAWCAAVSSAIAFVLSVAAPVFGWNQSIDDYTTRIHTWHYAERQIESALRFLRHTAQSKREADLQVQFADEAYRTADNVPDTGKQDMKLTKIIREEVERAIPPDYVWFAL